jgi:hypothetical protein
MADPNGINTTIKMLVNGFARNTYVEMSDVISALRSSWLMYIGDDDWLAD